MDLPLPHPPGVSSDGDLVKVKSEVNLGVLTPLSRYGAEYTAFGGLGHRCSPSGCMEAARRAISEVVDPGVYTEQTAVAIMAVQHCFRCEQCHGTWPTWFATCPPAGLDAPLYAHGLAACIVVPQVEVTSEGHLRIAALVREIEEVASHNSFHATLYWNGSTGVGAPPRGKHRATKQLGMNATLRDAMVFFQDHIDGFTWRDPSTGDLHTAPRLDQEPSEDSS